MKEILICAVVLILFTLNIFSQEITKISVQNPIDCAFDLIKSEDDLERWDEEISIIADLYWKLGERKKAFEVAELNPDFDNQVMNLLGFAEDFKKENKLKEYEEIYLKVYKILKENDDIDNVWKGKRDFEIIKILTKLGLSVLIFEEIVKTSEREDRAFTLIAIGVGYLEINQKDEALELLPQIIQNAELSKWKDLQLFAKAKAGTIYLKAGKIKQAKSLFEEVIQNLSSATRTQNISIDRLWQEVFEGYKSVGMFDDAISTLLSYRQTNTLNSERFSIENLVETYLLNNQKEKAIILLNELSAEDEDYRAVWLAEKYLEMNDTNSANNLFIGSKNDNDQQQIGIILFDYYKKNGKIEFAIEILDQILIKAEKIKSDGPELPMMSTSPARQKADYMAEIAGKFIELKRFDSALNVIKKIEKPYIKAQTLVKLAENEKSKNSIKLLDQAMLIMQNNKDSSFDTDKYKVLNEIALAYSNLGEKNKAIEVFDKILQMDRFNREKSIESNLVIGLAETGYFQQKARIGDNSKITKSLRQIVQTWEKEN